jgi:hypothetical protein
LDRRYECLSGSLPRENRVGEDSEPRPAWEGCLQFDAFGKVLRRDGASPVASLDYLKMEYLSDIQMLV